MTLWATGPWSRFERYKFPTNLLALQHQQPHNSNLQKICKNDTPKHYRQLVIHIQVVSSHTESFSCAPLWETDELRDGWRCKHSWWQHLAMKSTELENQSSSNIWYVFCKIVSITRTCQPASAMSGPVLEPMSVGLGNCQFVYICKSLSHKDYGGVPEAYG